MRGMLSVRLYVIPIVSVGVYVPHKLYIICFKYSPLWYGLFSSYPKFAKRTRESGDWPPEKPLFDN
jgi:hypothetical protein